MHAVAIDAAGSAYVVGSTRSTDLPTTPGAIQSSAHDWEVFVAKLNPAGTDVVYATYVGGAEEDYAGGIAVDAQGNAFVSGTTYSADFPTTAGAFQSRSPGDTSHAFVAKLNAAGTALVYSTYLGSSRESAVTLALAVDATGQATVSGYTDSRSFPTTAGALQPAYGGNSTDAFVARLNREGSALVYSTYLGGDGIESAPALAVDAEGNIYVTGNTYSANFPTTRRAYRREKERYFASYVAKINTAGDRLAYSTFIDGESRAIAVDAAGNAYVTGVAYSDQAITDRALQTEHAGENDAFVLKLNPAGSDLVYSTLLGGSGSESANAIAVDSLGQAYVTGDTTSPDLPLMKPLQSRKTGGPLLKSTDGGGTWDDIAALGLEIRSMVVDPHSTSTLYASGYRDILKSTDGGATWRIIAPGLAGELVIDPVKPGVLYAFNYQSINKSTDGGASWQRTDIPISEYFIISALVIDPKTSDTLYLSARINGIPEPLNIKASGAADRVMFKSTDGGANWSLVDFGFPVFGVSHLAIDPQSPSAVYALIDDSTLVKTTDGGASWFGLKSPGQPRLNRFVSDPTNRATLYGIGYGPVVKSTDEGYSWSPVLQRPFTLILAIDPQTPSRIFTGGDDGLDQTTDGGKTWRKSLSQRINAIAFDAKQAGTVYAATFPTNDAFVAKLNPAGTALVYSTYVGGRADDRSYGIAADAFGNAYVAGASSSADFPVTANAYQARGTGQTGFVIRIADSVSPRVTEIRVKSKKLLVSGEGFDQGATIVVNGTDFETQNDAATPSVLLISPRGGKQIPHGQSVVIRVRNADGRLSEGVSFVR